MKYEPLISLFQRSGNDVMTTKQVKQSLNIDDAYLEAAIIAKVIVREKEGTSKLRILTDTNREFSALFDTLWWDGSVSDCQDLEKILSTYVPRPYPPEKNAFKQYLKRAVGARVIQRQANEVWLF